MIIDSYIGEKGIGINNNESNTLDVSVPKTVIINSSTHSMFRLEHTELNELCAIRDQLYNDKITNFFNCLSREYNNGKNKIFEISDMVFVRTNAKTVERTQILEVKILNWVDGAGDENLLVLFKINVDWRGETKRDYYVSSEYLFEDAVEAFESDLVMIPQIY